MLFHSAAVAVVDILAVLVVSVLAVLVLIFDCSGDEDDSTSINGDSGGDCTTNPANMAPNGAAASVCLSVCL